MSIRHRTRWDQQADRLLKTWAGRRSATEIAAMIGCTRETVTRRISTMGLTPYHPARRTMTRRGLLLIDAAGLSLAAEPDIDGAGRRGGSTESTTGASPRSSD